MADVRNVIGKKGPMDSRFTATLIGGAKLDAQLAALEKLVMKDVARDAVEAGLMVIRDEARALAPVGEEPPHIRDAIAVKAGRSAKGARGTVGIRPIGVADNEEPARYGPRLEFGDSTRAPEPFMRPAFDATSGKAADKVGEVLAEHIQALTR